MSTLEERQEFAEQFADRIPAPAIVAPPKPAPVMDEGGFDLGADLASAPEKEIGVVKVPVRDKSGRPR